VVYYLGLLYRGGPVSTEGAGTIEGLEVMVIFPVSIDRGFFTLSLFRFLYAEERCCVARPL